MKVILMESVPCILWFHLNNDGKRGGEGTIHHRLLRFVYGMSLKSTTSLIHHWSIYRSIWMISIEVRETMKQKQNSYAKMKEKWKWSSRSFSIGLTSHFGKINRIFLSQSNTGLVLPSLWIYTHTYIQSSICIYIVLLIVNDLFQRLD